MGNIKNIITLLNNPDTLELGATLAVSQGLNRKIKCLYKAKKDRQSYKYRAMKKEMFNLNKALLKTVINQKKSLSKSKKECIQGKRRSYFSDVIMSINDAWLIAENNRIENNPNSNPLTF